MRQHANNCYIATTMNFLSHFYFDRDSTDCYHVLGTVMPDLLKNADKTIVLHPDKHPHADPAISSIIAGWHKHLEVDKYFHSSEYFIHHSHQLKKALLPAIEGSPVKPFFLGHVAVELLLDNLLLTTNKITVESFYDHLEGCGDKVISEFLLINNMRDPSLFLNFYARFKKDRYLETYVQTVKIAYALKRICTRIWKDPFTQQQEEAMEQILDDYRLVLIGSFMTVFDEIESKLQ